jgi:thiol-disulfide isomerase/thioredoxin
MEQQPEQRRGARTGAIVAIVVVIAAAGGFFLQRRANGPATPAPLTVAVATPAADSAAAPAPSDAAPARKPLPETLPQFVLTDRAGKPRKLGDWAGQPLVVNYWATWCPPCVREIPLLSKLRRDRAAQKVEVIGIAVDFRDDVIAFADREKLDYPLLIGEEDGLEAVGAVGMEPAFPFTLFADSQQRILALKVGELHQEELDLILDRIVAVDAGRLDLGTARTEIGEGLKAIAAQRAVAEAAAEAGRTGS